MVEKQDEHGMLDDWNNKIHFKTKPSNPRYLFGFIGCAYPKLVPENVPQPLKCPYHKPGGLKQRWDRMIRKGDNGIEKLREERATYRAVEGRRIEREKQKRARKELDDDDDCCIVQ